MNKPGKRIIISAIACFVVGVMSLTIGLLMGANFRVYIDSGGVRFAEEISLNVYPDSPFTSITVHSNIADVEITAADSFSASLFTNYGDVEVSYYVFDGTLHIYIEREAMVWLYPGFVRPKSVLSINMPKEPEIPRISVTNTNYDISITGLNVSEIVINSTNGEVNLYRVYAYFAEISALRGGGLYEDNEIEFFHLRTYSGTSEFVGNNFYELRTSSQDGSFMFDGCRAEWFNANTRGGNITATNIETGYLSPHGEASGHINIINTFGNISITGIFNGRDNTINSTNGDISITHYAMPGTVDYRLATTHGRIYINGERSYRTVVDNGAISHMRVLSRLGDIRFSYE